MAFPGWTWSEPHKDFYYVTYNGNQAVYHWYKNLHAPQETQPPAIEQNYGHAQYPAYNTAHSQGYPPQQDAAPYIAHTRGDSAYDAEPNSNRDQMPPPIPTHIRQTLPDLIPGTPDRGWYETLDSSYKMRMGREAHQFFRKGRVFAMLWAEAASEIAVRRNGGGQDDATVRKYNDPFTVGRFGQAVFSQIRRFVIMRVKKREHFVYACPITTYSGRATTKSGCNPREHAAVYFSGSSPEYLEGEYGIVKEPIEVVPSSQNEVMEPASRLRFGKTYPVEWNVKVKDIGKVHSAHMSKLIRYWKEEGFYDSDPDDEDEYPQTIVSS